MLPSRYKKSFLLALMCNKLGFHCEKCGECCRHIDQIPQLAEYDNGNGVCIYLNGNLCSIYSSRPQICSVDTMYKKEYSSQFSKDEFYRINELACKEIRKKYCTQK